MPKEEKYSRLILKRSDTPSLSATTAPNDDHTGGLWTSTDIYVAEMFLNTSDSKLWVRIDNSIKEIPLCNITSPTNGQVLTYTNGTWENKTPDVAGTGLTYTVSPLNFPSMSTPSMMSVDSVPQELEKLSDINDIIAVMLACHLSDPRFWEV